jgi:hypothetical protein
VAALLALATWVPGQGEAPKPAAAVRILQDALGFPHVFAESDAGLFRGLGHAQVYDFPIATLANLWADSGRFAEVAGPAVLPRDERLRLWGIDREAAALARDPARLGARAREWLTAYVAGVNEGRRVWLAHPEWIDALADGGALGFEPVPPWLAPQRAKSDARARLERLFAAEIELEHVLAHGVAFSAGPDFGGAGYATFTNLFLVRGSENDPHTRFLADVHQPLLEAGYRSYPAQLSGPSYDMIGNTVPGFPCIVLGAGRRVAFGSMTLPRRPRGLVGTSFPFRIDEHAPHVHSVWSARLEADAPLRFARGAAAVELIERTVTLRVWDDEQRALVDDPRGALRLRWVRGEGELEFPVTQPGPREPLGPGATIHYEARSFLGQRSAWETWMRLGQCARVGASTEGHADGSETVLEQEWLSTGRGQIVLACDVEGGLEFRWSTRVPRLGAKAMEQFTASRDERVLDGHEPAGGWLGFHEFEELPGRVERAPRGPLPAAWIECNSSPQLLHPSLADLGWDGPPTVWDGVAWANSRQARARELFEQAAADGKATLADLQHLALDVQDQWSRAHWPWIAALRELADPPLAPRALEFLAWVERFRHEGPDGKPGAEEFLAHPRSQVLPFLILLRDRYRDTLLASNPDRDALEFAFDPARRATPSALFLSEPRYVLNRTTLRAALEWVADLWARTRDGESGRLVNAEFWSALAAQTKTCAPSPTPEAFAPLAPRQAEEWGPDAPPVLLRWGEVNALVLTPHRWSFAPKLTNPKQVEGWLASHFAPCTLVPPLAFHTRQAARVYPSAGTHDTLFQVHREDLESYAKFLIPRAKGQLFIAPVDFGSQSLFLAELVPDSLPLVRILPALSATEITVDIPGHGARAGDMFRPTERFQRGEWSAFATDEGALRGAVGTRELRLP